MTDDLRKARDEVLVENTAQAVFKHLDHIQDNRGVLGTRWIWELLQNARDAAGGQQVRVRVRVSATECRFEHDGRPFKSKEISHLIYHGSTKADLKDIGQFGSGFLATHLLSKIVHVVGRLVDSGGFDFPLDRTGETAEELHEAMDRSWNAFERSIEDGRSAPGTTTSFTYDITEPAARELVETGLQELHRSGSLVLAFSPEITEVAVETSDTKWKLTRDGPEEGGLLTIRYAGPGGQSSRFVAVSGPVDGCCAALLLRSVESGLEVDPSQETAAKLFVLFPLVGSEQLGLPATVNSPEFKPREDRDGIVAGDSPGAQKNRQLLEDSARHQEQLLERCARKKWPGGERMLAFDIAQLPDWARRAQWFRPLLTRLVRKARKTPLMRTPGGEWIQPRASWVPTTDDSSHREPLWKLISQWKGAQAKLPRLEDLALWSRNLSGWQELLREEMDEALTITMVAHLVGEARTVDELRKRLASDADLSWLVSLLELVLDAGETELLDAHNLLPTQASGLRRRPDVRRDEGICEELKDIAEAFGLAIRHELLDERAEVEGLVELLPPGREPDLLDKVLDRVREEGRDGVISTELAPWAVKLFRWIADRPDYAERLDGYPVPTCEPSEEGVSVLLLDRALEARRRPLAPMATWPERARPFGALFPSGRILAEDFADGDREVWPRLAERGYVNESPLIETRRVVRAFLPDEPLPDTEETPAGSHRSTQELKVSDVAWLVGDKGVIDTARKSRKRATEFVQFLVKFAAEADERAFEVREVECECGDTHRTYRAAWLAPVRRRHWVPSDASGRRGTIPSVESLAGLLADSPEVSEILSGDRGKKLLAALAISRADLALRVVASDEEDRLTLIGSMQDLATATGGIDGVRKLVDEIRDHPEIIDSIEKRKDRRTKIQRNQKIGISVEDLLRQELEGHGLTVRRTGIGSDFEVESDFVEKEQEMGLELSGGHRTTLIEVKSTRIDKVKMTPTQAQRACESGDDFALCVVPLGEDPPTAETIREGLRVVFGIGTHLELALLNYELMQDAANAARGERDGIELEIREGQVRFQIGRQVWEEGLPFGQAVARFRGRD